MSRPAEQNTYSSELETLYLVREVHNFGGFFGGDTVTLTATPRAEPEDEQTLTIDEKAFTNVADRYTIAAGMLLALSFAGDRIERARLLGAQTHAELRAALGPATPQGPLDGPLLLSYRCATCQLWVDGSPEEGRCRICGNSL